MELRFRWCAFSVVYICAFMVIVCCGLRFPIFAIFQAHASWPLTFWPWKWCPSHMWRGLPLCQFWSSHIASLFSSYSRCSQMTEAIVKLLFRPDSPIILVFFDPERCLPNSKGVQNTGWVGKTAIFDWNRRFSETVWDNPIVAMER